MNNIEYKICQLADDTTIFIKNLKSLQSAIDLFQNFQKCSGLKLNVEKTEIFHLGLIDYLQLTYQIRLTNSQLIMVHSRL